MSAATQNEMERLRRERDALAEKLAVATKRLEDGPLAPVGWVSGDRYEAVSREKMDYRRRWKEVCEERDALTAHVERLHSALEAAAESPELGGGEWYADAVSVLSDTPATLKEEKHD